MFEQRVPAPTAAVSADRDTVFAFVGVTVLLLSAEGFMLVQRGNLGLAVHTLAVPVLVWLVHRSDGNAALLFQSLLLLPILRVFNLGIPAFTDNSLVFLGTIYAFLLVSVWIVVRSQGLSLEDLGMTWWDARLVVPGAVIGLGLGLLQYRLSLESISYAPTLRNYVLVVLSTGLLVGLVEELVFRGLVQRWADKLFTRWPAIVVVSVLFGAMHSIWVTPMDVVFAGTVSVFLGWAYAETENMWFVTSIHGMINVGAFLLAPLYLSDAIGVLEGLLG